MWKGTILKYFSKVSLIATFRTSVFYGETPPPVSYYMLLSIASYTKAGLKYLRRIKILRKVDTTPETEKRHLILAILEFYYHYHYHHQQNWGYIRPDLNGSSVGPGCHRPKQVVRFE